MTELLDRAPAVPPRGSAGPARSRRVITARTVRTRRLVGLLIVTVPLAWAVRHAVGPGTDLVNHGGLPLLGDLFASAVHPALEPGFLALVLNSIGITVAFAALGTAGALVVGLVGGLILSDVAWTHPPGRPLRAARLVVRCGLVATRSVHEVVWALLFVSVLGLDSLVAVVAIALPFGAQTAQVFGRTLDGLPRGPLTALRSAGARALPSMAYGLLPAAAPLLLSYSFYRFECAIRSTVLLGVVGVGGLGQEMVVSLQSRNWNEVWTLVAAVLVLSALVDLWSTRVRSDMRVVTCSDWSGGQPRPAAADVPTARDRTHDAARDTGRAGSRWVRWSAVVVLPGLVLAWLSSGVSLAGLSSSRTRDRTGLLLQDLWPPQLPRGGASVVAGAVLDTVAMAILAMAVAVAITLVLGPWATSPRRLAGDRNRWLRRGTWWCSRIVLLVLRSVPPTIWAVVALLVLFPGVLPGALALGLYTGGILGRLVAEAWESIDPRATDALRHAGVATRLAAAAATVPPSVHQLLTYTLYRFEICLRDTAVVGIVGAAGLGQLLADNLAAFRFPAVSTVLAASCALSIATEVITRRLQRATG